MRLKNDFKPQPKPFNTTAVMKKIFAILASVIAVVSSSQAALVSYTDSQTIDTTGVAFSFTQFNPSLGSLSAVELIINSSIPGGSFYFTKTGAGSSTFLSFNGGLQVYTDNFTIFDNTTTRSLSATPVAGNGTFQSASDINNRSFNVTGSQSLIASTPTTESISSGNWSDFTGLGTITLYGLFNASATATGSNVTPNYGNLTAPTSLTVQYTYTAPSGVPEPSQVAASLLVIGGLGIYFLRRRRKVASL